MLGRRNAVKQVRRPAVEVFELRLRVTGKSYEVGSLEVWLMVLNPRLGECESQVNCPQCFESDLFFVTRLAVAERIFYCRR